LAEAQALVVLYQHRYCHRRSPSADELMLLTGLEQAIDTAMSEACLELGCAPKFFVRLSSRSPKDAAPVRLSQFQDALRQVEADPEYSAGVGASFDVNRKMVALSDCMSDMAVTTGLGAMTLLTSSERTFGDLITATATEELYAAHPMKVILRVWEERLDHRMEFRAFVCAGELTAMSQYNHYCYFPEVVRRKGELLEVLRSFWDEEVRQRVPLPNYVVDFAVMEPAGSASQVAVVELNPFETTTGGALYDWSADADLLRNGPLGLRVHEAPLDAIAQYVDYCIEEISSGEKAAADKLVDWRPKEADPPRAGRRCMIM